MRQQRIKQHALLQAHAEGGETVEMVTNPLARSKAVVHLEPNPIYMLGGDGGAPAQTVINSSYAVLSSPRIGSTATVKEGGKGAWYIL